MQTLKTSAIVVLLVTVMYAAYVSITAPPPVSGPEMEELILASEDLDIDAGLPDSLGGFVVSDGELPAPSFGLPGAPADASSDPDPSASTDFVLASPESTSPDGASGEVRASMDDSTSQPIGDGGVSMAMSDGQPAGSLAAGQVVDLPRPNGKAPRLNLDPTNRYASTGQEFRFPAASAAAEALPRDEAANDWSPDESGGVTATVSDQAAAEVRSNPMGQPRQNPGLNNAINMADRQYTEGKKKKALATLSLFYDTPDLTDESRSALLTRLDPLAREVIYSREHLLEQPHRVRQNETLMQIAAEYEVPWQLLANINGVDNPVTVLPGTDLKVVRGPFRADVDVKRNELTLFLGDLYAGRFPIAIGKDPKPQAGTFTVLDKQSARTYYDANGAPVPPGSENNPYGSMWIDLGGRLCIHGSPDRSEPTDQGCISVAGRYAGDLYGILSQGSTVTIRR